LLQKKGEPREIRGFAVFAGIFEGYSEKVGGFSAVLMAFLRSFAR
jgi:hypothetical protein